MAQQSLLQGKLEEALFAVGNAKFLNALLEYPVLLDREVAQCRWTNRGRVYTFHTLEPAPQGTNSFRFFQNNNLCLRLQPQLQLGNKILQIKRLGEIIVHPGSKASVTILFQGVSGEGNDRNIMPAYG